MLRVWVLRSGREREIFGDPAPLRSKNPAAGCAGPSPPTYLSDMALQRMKTQLLYPEFEAAIASGDPEALEALREQLTVEDFGELVEALEPQVRAAFFTRIPAVEAADIFEQLDLSSQRETLEELSAS